MQMRQKLKLEIQGRRSEKLSWTGEEGLVAVVEEFMRPRCIHQFSHTFLVFITLNILSFILGC